MIEPLPADEGTAVEERGLELRNHEAGGRREEGVDDWRVA